MDRRDILADLAQRSAYPHRAVDYCRANPDHTAAIFLPLLERTSNLRDLDAVELDALYFGVHLLALNRTPETFLPLARLVCHHPDGANRVLGETAIGTTLARVLMAVGQGRGEQLWDGAIDLTCDFLVRDAFLRAWTYEVMEGRLSHAAAERNLRSFTLSECRPGPDDMIWSGWLTAIADLGLVDLLPQVEQMLAAGHIPETGYQLPAQDLRAFLDGLAETTTAESGTKLQIERGYCPFGERRLDMSDLLLRAPSAANT